MAKHSFHVTAEMYKWIKPGNVVRMDHGESVYTKDCHIRAFVDEAQVVYRVWVPLPDTGEGGMWQYEMIHIYGLWALRTKGVLKLIEEAQDIPLTYDAAGQIADKPKEKS